jgi:predicted ATPase
VERPAVTENLIVITGPPGSGKTPIIRALEAVGYGTIPEVAREVIAAERALGVDKIYDTDPGRFLELMLARALNDHDHALATTVPVFFDRAIPDQVGYAELFGLDTSRASHAAAEHRYHERVFVLPSWPEIYVTDGDRRMTFEHAQAFGERVHDIYANLGYELIHVPRDTVTARVAFILDVLGLTHRDWYHGSPEELSTLLEGSTITQDRDLARAFSHKPSLVSQGFDDGVRQIKHSGAAPGYLYRLRDVIADGDVRPHPSTTMGPGQEWLTNRELRVELIEPTVVRPDEVLNAEEKAVLVARAEAARKERQT